MSSQWVVVASLLSAFLMTGCDNSGQQGTQGGQSSQRQVGPVTELVGSGWRLASVAGKDYQGDKERAPRIEFGDDGRVSGYGGCNQFSGSFERNGENLSFGPIAATKMACKGIGDLERDFFRALGDARRFHLEDDRLVLLDGTGAELAVLGRSGPK